MSSSVCARKKLLEDEYLATTVGKGLLWGGGGVGGGNSPLVRALKYEFLT
jgi:hypothetical protein